ncbi:uncharacterized protein VP01_2403g2 [Puccinia sorghi]|uniref:Myb/SANT-like domain-containing protein n=1 Tax=Puccinia sorghi TaxID=27349 RepID=A0A0L6V6U9_9BASI|nr:uncharacterized protein VP01_2403g2 [Puccinia sorghi]
MLLHPPPNCEEATQSQSSIIIDNTPTGRKSAKLFWTSDLERSALELYVQAVRNGKRLDNGFKPETHQAIAMALKDKFPNVDLDEKKYFIFFFLALIDLVFGWNEATSRVTAPERF